MEEDLQWLLIDFVEISDYYYMDFTPMVYVNKMQFWEVHWR